MAIKVKLILVSVLLLVINISICNGAPATSEEEDYETTTLNNTDLNSTEELYVVRAVVYEVGILVDGDNSTDDVEESHEEVDLTFYDPDRNESHINLANIPVPVQTNVSGQVLTALAPLNLGTIQLPTVNSNSDANINETKPLFLPADENATSYPLHNALVSITTNVSTTNGQTGSHILQGLPPLLNLPQTFGNTNASNSNN